MCSGDCPHPNSAGDFWLPDVSRRSRRHSDELLQHNALITVARSPAVFYKVIRDDTSGFLSERRNLKSEI